MPLRKPSEFFNEGNTSSASNNAEINFSEKFQKVETVSEAFNSFRNNLEKIDALSDFTETFDKFKDNVEKVSILSEEIDSIHSYIKTLLKKEDLENAMMSHLMLVEQNIQQIQKNVKSLNSKTIVNIKNDFSDLSEKVEDFISIEVPKYKRLIKETEIRVENKINSIDSSLEERVDDLEEHVNQRIDLIESSVDGINRSFLLEFEDKVDSLSSQINSLVTVEIPKYKKIIAESKLKNQESVDILNKKIDEELRNQNKKIEEEILHVNQIVESFLNEEIPKYSNLLIESKIQSENDLNSFKESISSEIFSSLENIKLLKEDLEKNNFESNNSFEERLKGLESDISISLRNIDSVSEKYKRIYEDFKNREIYNDEKLQSYSESIEVLDNKLKNIDTKIGIDLKNLEIKLFESEIDLKKNIGSINEEIIDKIKSIETDVYINKQHIKDQSKEYEDVKEEIYSTIKKLKVDYIEEQSKNLSNKISHIEKIFEKFNEKTLLTEDDSLLTGVSSEKTKDPLTPLDKNFVTFKDLSDHYRTFINRIQIQMASIGGGGAGFVKDLSDVDITGLSNGDTLVWNDTTNMWEPGAGGGSVGAGGTWQVDAIGIHTTKNVGIGTTANADYKLYVKGDAYFAGNISVAGTVTYDDVTNVDSIGIITAREDIQVGRNLSVVGITTLGSSNGIGTVTIGIGETALYVDGNARIVGILTVGRSSITIDGENNTVSTGIVTITNSSITIGNNVTLNASSSGINSAPNVIYVAKDGSDNNNGSTIDNAKLTISGAVSIAQTGTVIKVLSGTYIENNPIVVPSFVSVVGDSLKTVTVIPSNSTQDIFHLNKGTYLAQMTFTGHTSPAAAVAFPTTGASNTGGGDWESPYVQNCTSNTTTGTGMRIDGNLSEGLKSMVVDAYTQYNQGGVGIAITNKGYAQLVSVFTICCNESITVHKGGQCSLTNSNTDFGTYGLVADGVSDLQFSGIVTSLASAGQGNVTVSISTSTRPYQGQVVYFDNLYYSVESITVTNGGSGYTSAPTVSISSPTGPNGITATAFATLNGGSVESITIITSGNQYLTAPSITISAPDNGTTATAEASLAPIYYTINSSTPVTAGITTLTLDENLINSIGVGSTVNFYQVSKITATSHTFEYVGSGNTISTATPARGGVANQENEIVERNGGRVTFTSTDQAGNFRIGNDIVIDQNTGTITGRAFTRSLFTQMTPFILALS